MAAAQKDLVAQLREAYERTGWSLAELLERSGLQLSVWHLRRMLISDGRKGRTYKRADRGELVPMPTRTAEALADALEVVLVHQPRRRAARHRAARPAVAA